MNNQNGQITKHLLFRYFVAPDHRQTDRPDLCFILDQMLKNCLAPESIDSAGTDFQFCLSLRIDWPLQKLFKLIELLWPLKYLK